MTGARPGPPWDLSTRDGYRQMLESGPNTNPVIVEEILNVYFPGGATSREVVEWWPPEPSPRRPRPAPQDAVLFDVDDP